MPGLRPRNCVCIFDHSNHIWFDPASYPGALVLRTGMYRVFLDALASLERVMFVGGEFFVRYRINQ